MQPVRQAELAEEFGGPGAAFAAGQAVEPAGEQQVVGDAGERVERAFLEDGADVAAGRYRWWLAEDGNGAGVGRLGGGQESEEGAFAASVGPEQAEDRTTGHPDGEPVEAAAIAISPDHVRGFNYRRALMLGGHRKSVALPGATGEPVRLLAVLEVPDRVAHGDQQDDGDERAEIDHAAAAARDDPPDGIDDRFGHAPEHLVDGAALVDVDPAQQGTRDDRPDQDLDEGIGKLGDVGMDGDALRDLLRARESIAKQALQ